MYENTKQVDCPMGELFAWVDSDNRLSPALLPLIEPAVNLVVECQRGSPSLLQRRLGVGYTQATQLLEAMRNAGVIGPQRGCISSEVLIDEEEWERAKRERKANRE